MFASSDFLACEIAELGLGLVQDALGFGDEDERREGAVADALLPLSDMESKLGGESRALLPLLVMRISSDANSIVTT
ncbi:hypothetical protein M407DRAFT_34322 [Tulasnella calospora MUT 4182]|uniref:Uncharacterized protein n=1 Tax=Tulasnella calospora MUT 4182 TaxID=1051891 RepID=A0A0C3Q0U6_9AGAM|nr:hypothetical protein M407DRAFT_34322 [Tulasnella calospora MUT 4182]